MFVCLQLEILWFSRHYYDHARSADICYHNCYGDLQVAICKLNLLSFAAVELYSMMLMASLDHW